MGIKKNIISFSLFIYLICIFSFSTVKSENVLGEIEISETYSIDSSALNGNFYYKSDSSITKPKLVVTLLKGEVDDITDIARENKDKNSVSFGDFTHISSTNQVNVIGIKSIIAMAIGLLSLGFISKKSHGGNVSYIVFGVVFVGMVLIGVSNSLTISDISVKVEITVPTNFKFESLTLKVGSGSSNIVGLFSKSIKVDACSTNSIDKHQVALDYLSISSSLDICSNGNINIYNLILLDKSSITLETTSDINLNFYNGFTGSVNINSTKLNIDSGCDLNTNGRISNGICKNGDASQLVIKNSNTASIKNVAETCPVDPKWRPTPASGSISSPPISTTQDAVDTKYNGADFSFMGLYGYSDKSILAGPIPNSFTLFFESWGPESNWLVSKIPTPVLRKNINYQLSFGFKLALPLFEYNNVSNITVSFYNIGDIPDPNSSDRYFIDYENPDPIYTKVFSSSLGDFTSSTEFKQNKFTFNPSVDIGRSIFAIRINKTELGGPDGHVVSISDLKLTIPSKTITTPTLLNKDSELITIGKPSTSLEPQDPSTCPYLANDIVHWHDLSIWGGSPPSPLSEITLPANKKVLISQCSISQDNIYKKIIIPATSELIFADSNITMHVQDIYVQGKLTMGTKTCRYNSYINIIFHGSKTTSDTIAQYYGSKGIAVASGGFISVQGKQYHYTWTKLAATAWSGDNVIYIQDSVNWEVGQQVVITTSIYEDLIENQNEVKTILAIDGKRIQFTEPLQFYHYGGQEYQAEVGLLSRRIVFRGDDDSSSKDQFGGHVLVNGEGQFSGLQLIKMGQTNIKARYPLHFHLANEVKNSYITDCSVVHSFYRCYTIHGTNNLTVERNVAFNATGHCYYLEDGVEQFNRINYNLGAYVHTIGPPAAGAEQTGQIFTQNDGLTQPADSAAGCFYITNAWNDFIGNAASGGWTGFAFPNLDRPIGNHRNIDMVPKQFAIKTFEGNTAHSSGYFWSSGSSIYVGANLTVIDSSTGLLQYNSGRFARSTYKDGIADEKNEVWMRYNNTKIYLSNRGVGHWGERVEVVGLEAYDSNRPGTLFGDAWLDTAIVNGQTGSLVSKSRTGRQGFQFYDTYVQTILSNVVFRNFYKLNSADSPETDNRVIISMTHSDVFKPQGISATIKLKTENVASSQIIGHRAVNTGSSRYFNLIDWDGSISGLKVPSLIGSHDAWWNFDSTCKYNTDWYCYVCEKGDKEIANLQFWIPNFIDRDTEWPADSYVGNISLFGSGITDKRMTAVTKNAGVTGVSNMGWYLHLTTGTPSQMTIWVAQVIYGNYVFLAIPYPAGTSFTSIIFKNKYVNTYDTTYTVAISAAAVRSGNGKTYFFDGTNLYLKVVNHALKGTEYFERAGVRVYDVVWENTITIQTTNTQSAPVKGFYKVSDFVLPSSSL
ncbi:hypothetical protein DICPUDRAFT_36074 [Dictyostelium purpureum]|uniref:G8 domain-containing protein n=1 Tax=Dictyostelium purpureum TaxID=5786 RepID=F0ZQD6_DICPU|nr:uncharacterized protein DICPUDRAFT_36074 [Dictyostelium purpureum]EGC33844.1 hypothetical protein DICPUDRAFT_36074 [Dictyostelium purpureum]|eukprot:XP_003289634.1 hypothetical protein DICPUDRAFT_36074 [Dictyostelium purpureum]